MRTLPLLILVLLHVPQEQVLAKLPDGYQTVGLFLPKSGAGIAYIAAKGDLRIAGTADQTSEPFEWVYPIQFSPDGKSIAYAAHQDQKQLVVTGTSKSALFERVGTPCFLADGRVAFDAQEGSKGFAIIGSERREHEIVGGLTVSPDGKTVAYCGVDQGKPFVMHGDKKVEVEGDAFGGCVFSPDGSKLACKVVRGNKQCIAINGGAGPEFNMVGAPRFSPEGRIVYVAGNAPRDVFLVIGGNLGPSVDEIAVETIAFSPDGKRCAYVARKKGSSYLVIDGELGEPFHRADPPVFSADGKLVAFVAEMKTEGTHLHLGSRKIAIPMDGRARRPVISPDGKRAAFAWGNGRESQIWAGENGESGSEASDPVFSADGKSVSFVLAQGIRIRRMTLPSK